VSFVVKAEFEKVGQNNGYLADFFVSVDYNGKMVLLYLLIIVSPFL
jgi:hypothetical protein